MQIKTLAILSVSALLGLSLLPATYAQDSGATAQDGHRGFKRAPGGMGGAGFGRGPGGNPERFIERHDTNSDGQVSLDEFVDVHLERVDAIFERRDDNGDGLISMDENTPPARPEHPNRPELDREAVAECVSETIADYAPGAELDRDERFDDSDGDGDGDGMLSLSEVTATIEERAETQFGRIDTDGNGFITASELEAHGETLREVRKTVRDCVKDTAA